MVIYNLERSILFFYIFADWPRADVILVSLSHGDKLDMSENILLGGYTDDKSQMVLIKVFGESADLSQKVSKNFMNRISRWYFLSYYL